MCFTYSLTKRDMLQVLILQANLWRVFPLLGLLVFVITLALEINAKGFLTTGSGLAAVTAAPLTMGFGFGLVFPLIRQFVVLPLQSSLLHHLNPALYSDLQLFTDSEGVHIVGAQTDFRSRWPELRGFMENEAVFVLCVSRSVVHVVPKTALSTDEISEFRELLSRKLKRFGPV